MTHLEKLKALLGGKNPDAVLITSEINQRYISGFPFTDGYVLVTTGKSYLVTDFRYTEAAKVKSDKGLIVAAPTDGMLRFIDEKLSENGAKSVAFEEATLSYADLNKIRNTVSDMEFVPGASEMLDGLRLIKDRGELEKMAKAQDIADAAFKHIVEFIKPEMTEIEVALELEFYMRRHGAESVSFDTITASGKASSMPHAVPRPVKLEKGFLTMDFGARVDGYCSDMTRTIVLGLADADMKKLYNTVLKAQLAGIEAVREGANCRGTDKVARDIIDGAGYKGCFGHSLGHGVGLYVHESPRLSQGADPDAALVRGQVVTVEPGIYIEGKYGCRIEDMVCVLEDGMYDFAHSPKELIEI